jgi:formylglycine-generating enzyme required for sulfatase activity
MTLLPAHSEILAIALEPTLVRIPAASFLMGSEKGQDCERPVHRVSIDSFLLAATQVTNEEYGRFLRATSRTPPPFWTDPNFNHPKQPVAGVSWHEAVHYC